MDSSLSLLSTNRKFISAYYSFYSENALLPEGIDGNLLTHLIVGWTGVHPLTGAIEYAEPLVAGLKRCVQLKWKFPHLKVMVVCGGGMPFSFMVDDPTRVNRFVNSCLELLELCELDGLDLDWEFPVWQSRKRDKLNFTNLLHRLREAFGSHYLLTAAVAAPKLVVDPAYDIPAIAAYLDFVNLMCYDFNLFKYEVDFLKFYSCQNRPLSFTADLEFSLARNSMTKRDILI